MTIQAQTSNPKPTHRLYSIRGEGKSAFWTPIGAAWPNKDGFGFSLSIDAVPVGGRVVLRAIRERTNADQGSLV